MRRDRQRLKDILDALEWIAEAIAGSTREAFVEDHTLRYAVAQQLTVIGEAAARRTPELKARYTAVPWTDVVRLRNALVHEYFGIYWPMVWQTAVEHTPVLRVQIAEILAAESSE